MERRTKPMGVKVRERPGKGWYVLIDWKGQRKAKCFGNNKKLAQAFALPFPRCHGGSIPEEMPESKLEAIRGRIEKPDL